MFSRLTGRNRICRFGLPISSSTMRALPGIVHDVFDHRLNGNGHAAPSGAAHHRLEVLIKVESAASLAALRQNLYSALGAPVSVPNYAAAPAGLQKRIWA